MSLPFTGGKEAGASALLNSHLVLSLTRQAMYVERNIVARSCNHCCSRKAVKITYSECVFVAFFLKRLIYCSEMYKCLHEFSVKTVPDTSLHETSDLI